MKQCVPAWREKLKTYFDAQGEVIDTPAFDAKRFVRAALQFFVFCFLVVLISSMAMVKPAHASGTVASINTYFVAGSGFGFYRYAATPAVACGDGGSQVTGPVVTQISSSQWQCTYTYVDNGTNFLMWVFYVSPACPANSSGTVTCTCTDPYVPDSTRTSCVVPPACPAHASGTPCVCDAGYQFDATRTSCSTCPITTPLTPLDPAVQPYEDGLIDMDNETQGTRDGAACIARVARAYRPRIIAGLVSGYRPPAYQTHIREVYDKWQLLKNNNDAACADTKGKVKIEFKRHSKFAHQPGMTSPHSSGLAVDIGLSDYTAADTIAAQCSMSRRVRNDRSHFESPR